ncbi:MAG: Rdx family protein [Chloroflexota bacterium]
MRRKVNITIEYCEPCGFLPEAVKLATEVLRDYPDSIGQLTLLPSGGGRFEVTVNDDLIFSRAKTGRFPELREIGEEISRRLT